MNGRSTERGQALILIVLAIVGLFGFAALAVDMGQVYSARRNAQNAADAAALAAAFDAANGSLDSVVAVDKAYVLASTNGFDNGAQDMVLRTAAANKFATGQKENFVEVNNPPIGGAYCGVCGKVSDSQDYFQVKIHVRLHPIFAQIIFKGAEQVTVESVAHSKKMDNASYGDAIHTLSQDPDSLRWNGNTNVTVKSGGSIYTSGGLDKDGSSGKVSVEDPGQILYVSEYDVSQNADFSPLPVPAKPISIGDVPMPFCPSPDQLPYSYKGINYYLHPDGIALQNNETLDLPPGVHCIDNGITLKGQSELSGKNVLLVMRSGGIDMEGGTVLDLHRPNALKDENGNEYGGLLIYVPKTNTSVLTLGGNSGTKLSGTIFAPSGTCDIGGTAEGYKLHTAIVCNQVIFHGTPDIEIIYKQEELFHLPPFVENMQ